MASKSRQRWYLSKTEINELCRRSIKYIRENDDRFAPVPYFWRDKPSKYWNEIGGLMIPYLKNSNGDPRSPINGNIHGLFFNCSIDKMSLQPPTFSYFGNERLTIAPYVIYNAWKNVYFADFYCHYGTHYVTLVITSSGSDADVFCKRHHLVRLKPKNNPFLTVINSKLLVTLGVNVELFYTNSINISSILADNLGKFTFIQSRGRGHSKLKGIPKNPECHICNLD
ncbi:phytanoyl-CoA hydroxylase-interacting protein-like [Saccostrea echinata]|uniref:phytanoyl-CoA hydroxylase-interacting protein-like n=1 Tax=Saccostrea echinata TaxID=191078 RepID=UPI002A7EF94B|nr:phytanoyl-CoA hydroxylase-interacting protein-like [Saccostrea echinata]